MAHPFVFYVKETILANNDDLNLKIYNLNILSIFENIKTYSKFEHKRTGYEYVSVYNTLFSPFLILTLQIPMGFKLKCNGALFNKLSAGLLVLCYC